MHHAQSEDRESTPSTSSHEEPDVEQSMPSEPPKKKRTRTLTTPHQASVLHALLAQSRFPTTQMREDVGKQIGLSARKVQIWFQNQRQKARRPRSQSATETTNAPPQYGPFTNLPVSAPAAALETTFASTMGPVPSSSSMQQGQGPYQDHFGRSPSPQSSQLVGPGVPGSSHFRESLEGPLEPSTSTRMLNPHSVDMYLSREDQRDASSTLAPLVLDSPPGTRGSFSAPGPNRVATTSHTSGRRMSSDSLFAHQLPDPTTGRSVVIPPPFTLQPQPQWEETSSFPSLSQPSSSWSRSSATASSPRELVWPLRVRDDLGQTVAFSHTPGFDSRELAGPPRMDTEPRPSSSSQHPPHYINRDGADDAPSSRRTGYPPF